MPNWLGGQDDIAWRETAWRRTRTGWSPGRARPPGSHPEGRVDREDAPVLVKCGRRIGRAAVLVIGLVEQVARVRRQAEILGDVVRRREIELAIRRGVVGGLQPTELIEIFRPVIVAQPRLERPLLEIGRSEERRVGKECRYEC